MRFALFCPDLPLPSSYSFWATSSLTFCSFYRFLHRWPPRKYFHQFGKVCEKVFCPKLFFKLPLHFATPAIQNVVTRLILRHLTKSQPQKKRIFSSSAFLIRRCERFFFFAAAYFVWVRGGIREACRGCFCKTNGSTRVLTYIFSHFLQLSLCETYSLSRRRCEKITMKIFWLGSWDLSIPSTSLLLWKSKMLCETESMDDYS